MTLTPEQRDSIREDVQFARRWTGTADADAIRDYYPTMDRIFDAVPDLLEALTTAETARDTAERQVQAVRDALAEGVPGFHAAGVPLGLVVKVSAVRAACEGGGGA